jgi:23S rRNA (guanosine2251-2'-O)-methyltransferase
MEPHSHPHSHSSSSRRPFAPRTIDPKQVIFGWHPVAEAVQSGKDIQRVMIQRDERGERTAELLRDLALRQIPVQRVPLEKLDRVTRKNHQGIIAWLSPIAYQPLEELVVRAWEQGKPPVFVALDGVTDVRNLGAIARSAECFGATGLILPAQGVAPIHEDAIKTSSGALLRLPVARVPQLAAALKYLATSGIQVIGVTEKGARPMNQEAFQSPVCLVLGDEGTGISTEVLAQCDLRLAIPMSGATGSLNVSVAAGIALYQLTSYQQLSMDN